MIVDCSEEVRSHVSVVGQTNKTAWGPGARLRAVGSRVFSCIVAAGGLSWSFLGTLLTPFFHSSSQ